MDVSGAIQDRQRRPMLDAPWPGCLSQHGKEQPPGSEGEDQDDRLRRSKRGKDNRSNHRYHIGGPIPPLPVCGQPAARRLDNRISPPLSCTPVIG
jgi:hypothetical protein